MKKTLVYWLPVTIMAFMLCLSGCKSDEDQLPPGSAGEVTLKIQDDGNVLLTVDAIENAETYNWYFGDDLVQTSEANTYLAKISGIYKVAGANNSGEGALSKEIQVVVGLPADANVITQETQDNGFVQLSVPEIKRATFYHWYLDGAEVAETEDPVYTAEIGGSYEVAGFNSIGEGVHSEPITVAITAFNILTEAHIPDATLREWIKTEIAGGKASYTNAQAAAYTGQISVSSMSIESMQGIEFFTGITELACGSNKFTEFDASLLVNLVSLDVSNMDLKKLTLGNLPKLELLDISRNLLEDIDVSGCPAIKTLNIFANKIATLDIKNHTALEVLNCYSNSIATLDLTGLTALNSLVCGENELTSLNLRDCTKLTELYFQNNSIRSIDLSSLKTQLVELNCSANPLTSLDLKGFISLTWLQCQHLSTSQSLDLSGCPKLELLRCESSNLTSLNVSKCTALKELYCYDNQLSNLDVSTCQSLTLLYCFTNTLTALDVSKCTNLVTLWCYGNKISTLKFNANAIKDLSCSRNALTSLTLANSANLTTLSCAENSLTSLDVSNCPSLQTVSCYTNPITSLNVSKSTALTSIDCYDNKLVHLDISGNRSLQYLTATGNGSLTQIKVWSSFDINNPPTGYYKPEGARYVYEFE